MKPTWSDIIPVTFKKSGLKWQSFIQVTKLLSSSGSGIEPGSWGSAGSFQLGWGMQVPEGPAIVCGWLAVSWGNSSDLAVGDSSAVSEHRFVHTAAGLKDSNLQHSRDL